MMKKMFRFTFSDKAFYTSLFAVGTPIVIQSLLTSSLNMFDTLMVGQLGETEIASVGVVNQIFFLFNFILIGVSAGCGVYISQFFGNKDTANIRKTLGISLSIVTLISLLFISLGLFIPEKVIGVFNNDPELISCAKGYFQIVCLSYIFTAITIAFSNASKNIGQTFIPMITSLIAVIINIVLNYILIFGKLSFDAMGVNGAATATLIARIIELSVLLGYIYIKKTILAGKLSELFYFSRKFLLQISKTVVHTVLIEIAWALGVVMYSVLYGKIGKEALATVQIYTTIQNFFLIIVYGLSNSSMIFVGNAIGSGDTSKALYYGKKFTLLGAFIGVLLAILMALSSESVMGIFNISEELRITTLRTIYVAAIPFIGFTVNTILIVGVLRGGGDTKYPLIVETITMWGIGVPLAFIGAVVLKLPIYWVVALVNIEEIVKLFFTIPRLMSNKWVKNMISNLDESPNITLTE